MTRVLLLAGAALATILAVDRVFVPELLEPTWLRWVRQAALHPIRTFVALALWTSALRPPNRQIRDNPNLDAEPTSCRPETWW